MREFFATRPIASPSLPSPDSWGKAGRGGAGSLSVRRGQAMAAGADDRLEGLSTWWSVLFEAHAGTVEAARSAQERLLERYGPAVRRYLLAAVHDAHTAE